MDRSVCMPAICFSSSISAVPTNQQFLGENGTCGKFQVDVSKAKGIVAYIQTHRQTGMVKSTQLVTQISYSYTYLCKCILYRISNIPIFLLQTKQNFKLTEDFRRADTLFP